MEDIFITYELPVIIEVLKIIVNITQQHVPYMGGKQDKPAWTACPPGVKITRMGGKISRDSFQPGCKPTAVGLPPGGKINWDSGLSSIVYSKETSMSSLIPKNKKI